MSADILSPKELQLTCNAALAVIDDLVHLIPKLQSEEIDLAEETEDAQSRLQAIVDATESKYDEIV